MPWRYTLKSHPYASASENQPRLVSVKPHGYKNARVFISLDHQWNTASNGFSSRNFLTSFASAIKTENPNIGSLPNAVINAQIAANPQIPAMTANVSATFDSISGSQGGTVASAGQVQQVITAELSSAGVSQETIVQVNNSIQETYNNGGSYSSADAQKLVEGAFRREYAPNAEKASKMVSPEIMVPLVLEVKELKFVKDVVVETAELVKAEKNSNIEYHIGTMIEIPRAALTADKIAEEAEFFSFGTNDLTQMTFGFSRDDAGKFLNSYYENKIYEQDPFAKLDQTGVGQLVKMAAEKGKATRPNIKLGICGEHGGDPSSVEFCHEVGLTYVSCSPFRVPIARLAAAQAAIKENQK